MSDMLISEAFYLISMICGKRYGKPLPKQLLTFGNNQYGWGIELNASEEVIDHVMPYHAGVTWNGFPAGYINALGGVIACGDLANESSLIRWLKDQARMEGVELC